MPRFFLGLLMTPLSCLLLPVFFLFYGSVMRGLFSAADVSDGLGFLLLTVMPGYLLAARCESPLERGFLLGSLVLWLYLLLPDLQHLGTGIMSWCGNGRQQAWSDASATCFCLGAAAQVTHGLLCRLRLQVGLLDRSADPRLLPALDG